MSRSVSPLGPQVQPTQLLPNKLSLKRRLAEYRNSIQRTAPPAILGQFSVGLLAVDRFKDLAAAFVVSIFEEFLVLEPGDVGPIPINHPSARDLIDCINHRKISPALMDVIKGIGAPFYDGCLVIGLMDYRKQAFGIAHQTGHQNSHNLLQHAQKLTSLAHGSSTGTLRNPNVHPELHKILLRPSYESMVKALEDEMLTEEESLVVESRILVIPVLGIF